MHVRFVFCVYLPMRVFHWAFPERASASFSVAHAVWAAPYLPPPPPPYLLPSLPLLLPRTSFPVLLSLPAAASLDFVSDFPRKGLCGGHGVKNTAFLMHSLGKQSKRPLPLSALASFFTVFLPVWHFFSLSCCLLNMNFTCLRILFCCCCIYFPGVPSTLQHVF